MKTLLRTLALLLLLPALPAAAEEPPILPADDPEALRQVAGQEVVVEGEVVSVGKTPDEKITFLNIGAPMRQGFVAVIFSDDYAKFPDGFEQLAGQRVRVSGLMEVYRETQPQIKVREPEQISVVGE